MKVYREGKEIFEIKDYKQVGSFMNVAYIDATVKSPTPFIFQIGDYVIFDYNGLTYTLYDVAPEKKQARSGTYGEAFIYELRFKADTEQLVICPFLDLVPNDNNLTYTSLPSFSTFENVYGIAARLQANMDYLYPNKWRFDVVDTTDESLLELLSEMREFSISGESCFDGLKKIYDTWGVSFIHTYEDGINVITIGKSAGTTSVFRYGKGQGLRTIKKNIQNSSELCTRAYVYGSTRNIPALWYNEKGYIGEAQYAPNLMIPPSKWVGGIPQGAYIDAIFDLKVGDTILTDADNRIEKYGLRIKTLSYDGSDSSKDEIYPSIEKVTAYDIRKAKEELGQETYIPSSRYPNNDRMDYILEGTTIEDDGIGTDAGYKLWSDEIISDIPRQVRQFEIAEQLESGKYKLSTLQQTITLCSFNVTKTAWYRIYEILDLVKFKKNDLESTVSATIILQKPSGEYIELRKLSFTDKLEASMQLPDTGDIKANEVGKYTLILKFNVSWDTDYVVPQIGEDVTLDCTVENYSVKLARGRNILATFFDIKIKQIGFNLNDVTASGLTKTIHIKSGMCAGRTFNITQCKYSESDDSWILTCKRIDDNAISQRFPNSLFPIAKDDQFVLLNIHMPDIYIHTAMQRLYNTAIEDLKHLSKPQYVIEPEIDNLQMARSPQIIKEGMYMPIEDTDISFIDDTLIDSVTITNKEKELRSFQVTLRSDKIVNTFSKLASRISDLENSLADTEAKSNISQAQDEDNTKINEGNAGLDESALAQYLEDNDYITTTDVEEIVKPVSDKVDDIEKELLDLGLSVKEENGKKYLESSYDFVTLGAISFGGKGESSGGGTGGGSTVSYAQAISSGIPLGTLTIDGVTTKNTIYAPSVLSAYTNDVGYITASALDGYLPKSGGTINGMLTVKRDATVPLYVHTSVDTAYTFMRFRINNVNRASVGAHRDNEYLYRSNSDLSSYYKIYDEGNLTALKSPFSLTVNNSVGTSQVTYDGSAAANLTLTKSMVGLGNVENTALSTWKGTSNITTVGTISSGVWNGTAITNTYINSVAWNKITSKPTTVSGYGITDMGSQTVASAGKLTTARSLWGNSFDGTKGFDGYLVIANDNGIKIKDSTAVEQRVLLLSASNNLQIGYDTAGMGYNTYLSGWNVYLRYGTARTVGLTLNTSGNVLIGATTDNGAKLQVAGNFVATGAITFGSDARYKINRKDVSVSLETIAKAPLFNYRWSDRQDDKEHLGTTAQYWYDTEFRNAVIPTTDDKLWTMSYSEIAMGNTIVLAREQIKTKSEVAQLKEDLAQANIKIMNLENQLNEYRRFA